MKTFMPADIIPARGFFAPLQQSPGEDESYAGHIAGVISAWPVLILHALWRVVTQDYEKFKAGYSKGFRVYRMRGLTDDQRLNIAKAALEYSGKAYPWWRLLHHGADYLSAKVLGWFGRKGELYFFRRLISDDSALGLCHRVWAHAYAAELGYEFGKPEHLVNPDQILDWIEQHPEDWKLIHEEPGTED